MSNCQCCGAKAAQDSSGSRLHLKWIRKLKLMPIFMPNLRLHRFFLSAGPDMQKCKVCRSGASMILVFFSCILSDSWWEFSGMWLCQVNHLGQRQNPWYCQPTNQSLRKPLDPVWFWYRNNGFQKRIFLEDVRVCTLYSTIVHHAANLFVHILYRYHVFQKVACRFFWARPN